jgi:hypothetical protein
MSTPSLVRLKERATTRQRETDVQCQLNDADGRRNPTNMLIRTHGESFMLNGTTNEDISVLTVESLDSGKFIEICRR